MFAIFTRAINMLILADRLNEELTVSILFFSKYEALYYILVGHCGAYVAKHRLAPSILAFDGKQHNNNPRCDLSPPVDPSRDGLVDSHQVFSWEKSIATMIDRLQSVVRLLTVCCNDMGDFDEDERWEPFTKSADVLNNSYPNM